MKLLEEFPLSGSNLLGLFGGCTGAGFLCTAFGVPPPAAAIGAVSLFAVSMILWAQVRIWRDLRFRYRLRELKRMREGEEVVSAIRRATTQLLLTHASRFVPTEEYNQEIHAALRRQVRVRRIVPKTLLEDPAIAKWLATYLDADAYDNYKLYPARFPELPTSFAVIDRHQVLLWLPGGPEGTNHAEYLVEFQNKELARIFEAIFEQLRVRFCEEETPLSAPQAEG